MYFLLNITILQDDLSVRLTFKAKTRILGYPNMEVLSVTSIHLVLWIFHY